MSSDEIYTPKWIFDALGLVFDLDVASSHHPLISVPTSNLFTIEDDGLTKLWFGNVWMNPPYSKPAPWVDKWLEHKSGICLVPVSSNGKWVNKLWDSEAAVMYLPPNMPFQGSDGKIAKMRWRVALWALGEMNITALKMSGLGRIR